MRKSYIKKLSSLRRTDIPYAGGKGAYLGELMSLGAQVPNGFVLSTELFREVVHNSDVAMDIDAELDFVDSGDIAKLESASEVIRARIKALEIPYEIQNDILKEFDALGTESVAVRSSSTVEDGEKLTWAGQHDTYLGVTRETLLSKIKGCWASMFTPRALYYKTENGYAWQDIFVAVVIQSMVNSEVSGVCFTTHPITENPNHVLVEACLGLGEKLVSGHIQPDNYVVDKEDLVVISKQINKQKEGIYCDNVGCREEMIEGGLSIKQKLSDEEILALAKQAIRIEEFFGFPCDIEWSFAGGELHILQCRPITTLKTTDLDDKPHEYKVLRSRKLKLVACMWNYTSRTSVETTKYHGICLPRAWTLFEPNGDLTSFVVESEWADIGKYFVDKYLEDPLYLSKVYSLQEEQGKKLASVADEILTSEILSSLPVESLLSHYKAVRENWERYNSINSIPWLIGGDYLKEHVSKLCQSKGLTDEEFTDLVTPPRMSFSAEEEFRILDLFLEFAKKGKLDVLKKGVCFEDLPTWAQRGIDSLVERFYWVPTGYDSMITYDREHYVGLLLENRRGDITELKDRHQSLEKYSDSTNEILKALSSKYNLDRELLRLVNHIHTFAEMADERKEYTFRSHVALHKLFDVLGKKTGLDPVVFKYLSYEETVEHVDNAEKMQEVYKFRVENPYVLYYEDGKYEIIEDSVKVAELKHKLIPRVENVDMLVGITVSTGDKDKVRGKVKVLLDHKEMKKVEKGDIVVSTMTTPEYAPAMRKASAVVTDEGGMTCHAAILSRELGVPCIIGTSNATKILRDGDVIELDLINNSILRVTE